jgi:hypothetical protein
MKTSEPNDENVLETGSPLTGALAIASLVVFIMVLVIVILCIV